VAEAETVIRAKDVGKKYVLSHRQERGRRHTMLRDVLAEKARGLSRRLRGRGEPESNGTREEFWALRDASFEVKRGEVVGIIGRNGAGKSTLLKILSRITEPTTGRIELDGRVASLLEVGTGFHPELTGRENVYLNGSILGMSRAEIRRKFDEIVAFAEVEKFLDTPVKRYSSGMYMRLAFAIAAHLEPEILVVDEVLAVGDADFQKKCLGKMGEVARAGRTILFVSHQLGTLRDLCTRGVLLESGRACSFDTIEIALRHYLQSAQNITAGLSRFKHIEQIRAGDDSHGRVHLFFGEPLVIRARLRNLPNVPTGFTVAIRDAFGKRLSLFSTDPHDGVQLPKQSDAHIVFTIDHCSYAPGEYYIDVAVTEPSIGIIEELSGAMRLDVLPIRRGGTLPYGSPFGDFFPPHSWTVAG
jgi:lipopolysaccharide transport system ATP-binding protein